MALADNCVCPYLALCSLVRLTIAEVDMSVCPPLKRRVVPLRFVVVDTCARQVELCDYSGWQRTKHGSDGGGCAQVASLKLNVRETVSVLGYWNREIVSTLRGVECHLRLLLVMGGTMKTSGYSHLAESRLVDRSFGRQSFGRQVVWPKGRLADWSLGRQVIWPTGRLADWSFNRQVVWPTGRSTGRTGRTFSLGG
ncbi:hypothetical protein M514_07269 [Trichuris suis]|uniref:Uncharacterized protein n=1 Tax=Trichuris suis TaxID=68888 RepID=A0A085N1J1_9BILA|nr:hypothetical protein M514_07269 [Trichuris suis]